MQAPYVAKNEKKRLQVLHDLDILDTAAEERFDRLTRIAKADFNVSITLISLIDTDRQWFKSNQGLNATETSFCGDAILQDEIFVIPVALEDQRFVDNPLVTGEPNIRFYAGAPLHAPEGECIGTLCIIDDSPRDFNDEQLAILRDLADEVEKYLLLGGAGVITKPFDPTSLPDQVLEIWKKMW